MEESYLFLTTHTMNANYMSFINKWNTNKTWEGNSPLSMSTEAEIQQFTATPTAGGLSLSKLRSAATQFLGPRVPSAMSRDMIRYSLMVRLWCSSKKGLSMKAIREEAALFLGMTGNYSRATLVRAFKDSILTTTSFTPAMKKRLAGDAGDAGATKKSSYLKFAIDQPFERDAYYILFIKMPKTTKETKAMAKFFSTNIPRYE